MKNLSIIAAIGLNNELGKDNNLVFHFKEDMKYFKEKTTNHPVIMGRKTFESLPHLLPNRTNIIVTRNKDYNVEGAIIFHSKEEVLDYVNNSLDECFIIGGASLYEEYLPYANTLYLTEVGLSAIADVFFPYFDKNLYQREVIKTLTDNNTVLNFIRYSKR